MDGRLWVYDTDELLTYNADAQTETSCITHFKLLLVLWIEILHVIINTLATVETSDMQL